MWVYKLTGYCISKRPNRTLGFFCSTPHCFCLFWGKQYSCSTDGDGPPAGQSLEPEYNRIQRLQLPYDFSAGGLDEASKGVSDIVAARAIAGVPEDASHDALRRALRRHIRIVMGICNSFVNRGGDFLEYWYAQCLTPWYNRARAISGNSDHVLPQLGRLYPQHRRLQQAFAEALKQASADRIEPDAREACQAFVDRTLHRNETAWLVNDVIR